MVPLVAIGGRYYGRKMRELGKETQAALALATNVADESLSHIRTVRAFARERLQVVECRVFCSRMGLQCLSPLL